MSDRRMFIYGTVAVFIFAILTAGVYSGLVEGCRTVIAVVYGMMIGLVLLGTPVGKYLWKGLGRITRVERDCRSALIDAAQEVETVADLDELLDYIVTAVIKCTGADKDILFIKDDGGLFRMHHRSGTVERRSSVLRLDQGVGRLLTERGFLSRSDEKDLGLPLFGHLAWMDAELIIPFSHLGEIEGLLVLGRKSGGGRYGQREIGLLKAFAVKAAGALNRARLHGETVTDLLTGLYHRKYFLLRMKEELAGAKTYRYIPLPC